MNRYVDVAKYGFVVEPRYYFFGWSKESRILGRESAVKALKRAQKLLPEGHRFKIWDFQRPRYVQLNMIESFRRRLKALHPKLNEKQLQKLIDRFAAKPLPDKQVTRPDCHRNGGAVDLTIIDSKGQELYMGTDHDDLTKRAATDYYNKLKNPTRMESEAKFNRQLLIDAMTSEGWENYAPEWWHWSTTE